MSQYDSRKQLTQAADMVSELNAAALDACKKPRTMNNDPNVGEYLFSSVHNASPQTHFIGHTGTNTYCCSSRENKGHGRQIAQLHNIECIQTESTIVPKPSQLEKATTSKPINPMAPDRPRPKLCTKVSQSTRAPASKKELGLKLVHNVLHLYESPEVLMVNLVQSGFTSAYRLQ